MLRWSCLFVIFLLSTAPAAGQDAIERCRQAASDAERIACLEAELSRQSRNSEAPGTPPAGAEEDDVPAPVPPAVPDPVAASERDSDDDARNVPEPAPAAAQAQANPAPQPGSGSGERAAADIGAEQLARRRGRDDETDPLASASDLVVASFDYVPYDRLQVTLENGQVWLQITGDTQRVRASLRKNRTVDIEESPLGGYKLRLNEMRRTIRVERVR